MSAIFLMDPFLGIHSTYPLTQIYYTMPVKNLSDREVINPIIIWDGGTCLLFREDMASAKIAVKTFTTFFMMERRNRIMAAKKTNIPDYGTAMRTGIEYYRTRVKNADGKMVELYALTKEELYQKEIFFMIEDLYGIQIDNVQSKLCLIIDPERMDSELPSQNIRKICWEESIRKSG